MKRILFGIIWLAALCAAGFVAGVHFARYLHGHGAALGLAAGAAVFLLSAVLGWLPGVRRKRAPRWGLVQAFWLVSGFMIMQLAGMLGCTLLITGAAWVAAHRLHLAVPALGGAVLIAVVAGYVASALWSFWYIGRLGPARLRDGSVTGIAWRRAPGWGYFAAFILAVLIIGCVVVIVHVVPPNMTAIKDMPSAKLFGAPGWPTLVLAVLAVIIAPPVEEYVFRGGVFAALASRFSPLWAGVITTAVFMAVHAPEKIYYPAGFIDVGLMAAAAAWLRVRFGSIRPGILLHLLYNFGLVFAAGTMG
jgi:membrane protease YdiL (CAAX protease family)